MQRHELFVYSWVEDVKDEAYTSIRVYGIDSQNKTTCLRISNFTPYVYLELPLTIEWNDTKSKLLMNRINERLHTHQAVNYQLVRKKRLYYANLDSENNRRLYPYLLILFNHRDHIRHFTNLVRYEMHIPGLGTISKLKVHENKASPILQLTSNRKISPAGWLVFEGTPIGEDERITTCDFEYSVSWKRLSPVQKTTIGRPYLMGYDIEVNSEDPTRMPKATEPKDEIFQISCVFLRQGEPLSNCERYLLTLGKLNSSFLEPNTIVNEYLLEADLLEGFVDLIQQKQPNVVIGYNIFTFDIPYMITRAVSLKNTRKFFRQGFNLEMGSVREIKWKSSAYGDQIFQFLEAEGRIFVDLLPLIKRDYKLSDYKLKTVSKHFLKDMTKDPFDAKDIFKAYRLGMKGGEKGARALGMVGKYCVKDSELVVHLFETLTSWTALCEMASVTNVPIFDLYTRGQQLKVYSQVYKKCSHENIIVESDAYVSDGSEQYVGAKVFPPVPGSYDKVLPFDFASLYPTTMIAYNICPSTLVIDETIPDSLCHVMEWEDHIGCEHDPKEIRRAELTATINDQIKIIKAIRTERDSQKKVDKEVYNKRIKKLDQSLKSVRDERKALTKTQKPLCCHRKYRWLKHPIGVLPEILKHLLDTRKTTKKEMGQVGKKLDAMNESDPLYLETKTYKEVLNQRQLALKVSANSVYGATGVRVGKGLLPCMPVAMSTTYKGRIAVQHAAKTIQEVYGGVLVYGDTDSNYITFPKLETASECWEYATKVAELVSNEFPRPMSLAFEETIYWRFFIITKKRYMSLACGKDGIVHDEIHKKGVLLTRRDNCNFVRTVYGNIIMKIFQKENKESVIDYILAEITNLFARKYDLDYFAVTKSVQDVREITREAVEKHQIPVWKKNEKNGKECWMMGGYTVKKCPDDEPDPFGFYVDKLPAVAQLALKMTKRGQLVSSGSRLGYVITTTGGVKAKQSKKIESIEYYTEHKHSLAIDYLYYLKQLATPLDQVMDIAYKTDQLVSRIFKGRIRYNAVLEELKNLYKTEFYFKE